MQLPRARLFHAALFLTASPFLLTACGGSDADDDGDPTGPPNGSSGAVVSGQVSHAGAGVGSVDVTLSGDAGSTQQATTSNDGSFRFDDVDEGSWTIEFEPPAYFEMAPGQDATRTVSVGSSGTTTVNATLAPPEERPDVEIGASGTSFTPNDVTIPPGTRVRWVLGDNQVHTVTPDGHSEWSEGNLSTSNGTFEAVLNNPGTFDYYCVPHRAQGMEGVLRVEP